MSVPCISIRQHGVGIYEWKLLVDGEIFADDLGDASITECLIGGAQVLPENASLVEVKYRGFHLGTFRTTEIIEHTEGVAERIVALYAEFIQHA
jgi:hypothetical protein